MGVTDIPVVCPTMWLIRAWGCPPPTLWCPQCRTTPAAWRGVLECTGAGRASWELASPPAAPDISKPLERLQARLQVQLQVELQAPGSCRPQQTRQAAPDTSSRQATQPRPPDTSKARLPPQTSWRCRVSDLLSVPSWHHPDIMVGRHGQSGSGPETELPSPEDQHGRQAGWEQQRDDPGSENSLHSRPAIHSSANHPTS